MPVPHVAPIDGDAIRRDDMDRKHSFGAECIDPCPVAMSADMLLALGMQCATGVADPADLVSAHKWFNLAALRGSKDAIGRRQEIAAEMSPTEIAAAQRAAREWLATH
jgi:TPR repeat protein